MEESGQGRLGEHQCSIAFDAMTRREVIKDGMSTYLVFLKALSRQANLNGSKHLLGVAQ